MISYNDLIKKHKILHRQQSVDIFNAKEPFHAFEGFGIECGKGWFDLLDKLCTDIEKELVKIKDYKEKYPFKIDQIKEKFGGLRFYVSSCTDKIYKMIDEAEEKSYTICEGCGERGKKYIISGWHMTLCWKCAIERYNKKKNSIIESMAKTQQTINNFSAKQNITAKEQQEFIEAKEWFDGGNVMLIDIDKKIEEIKYRSNN